MRVEKRVECILSEGSQDPYLKLFIYFKHRTGLQVRAYDFDLALQICSCTDLLYVLINV